MTDPPADGDGTISVTDSGDAKASKGGFAISGVVAGDAKAEYHEHHHAAPAPPPVWPVQIGRPPALASAFQPRQGLRDQIRAAHRHGDDVVLTQQTSAGVLAGGGGVGKTQLEAWFAHHAIEQQTTTTPSPSRRRSSPTGSGSSAPSIRTRLPPSRRCGKWRGES